MRLGVLCHKGLVAVNYAPYFQSRTTEPFRAVKDRKQYHERSQLKKSVIRKAIALILTLVAQKALDNPACFNTALAVCLDLIALSTTNLRCV